MRLGNVLMIGLLRSPLHRVVSGALGVIRYTGRRSGRQFSLPTQYVQSGDEVLVLVGRPEAKTWWRNFRNDRDLDVLLRGRWVPMTARVVVGAEEPDTVRPLLDVYLDRFPKAARALGDNAEHRARRAVMVRCKPR